jgi:hypothetical protein
MAAVSSAKREIEMPRLQENPPTKVPQQKEITRLIKHGNLKKNKTW